MLALRHDIKAIDRVQYNLFNEPREIAVRVLELIDEVLPRRLAQGVVAALQSLARSRRPGRACRTKRAID